MIRRCQYKQNSSGPKPCPGALESTALLSFPERWGWMRLIRNTGRVRIAHWLRPELRSGRKRSSVTADLSV